MAEQYIYELKIDTGFKRLIPPLSAKELEQLEQNIIRDGCREPICVWNNTIVDGHNRYEICKRQQISFTIQHIDFENREEAAIWICANQLGRRNITEETRKYLIGKRYEMEKILGAHNAAGINQHTKKEVSAEMLPEPPFGVTAGRTRERLGQEYNISHATIVNYEKYSQALDSLSRVVPEVVPKILSGKVKISLENTVELSQLSGQEVKHLCQHMPDDTMEFDRNLRMIFPKKQGLENKSPLPIPAGSVKNMPAYDPDAEISSLALTIPSWISSINRTCSTVNLSVVTDNACSKLEHQLLELKNTINSMLAAIKEEI
ncbi:MAG TPA: hypothetical protein DDY59_11685 [Lachnospiraceae bacterium]|jgi:hypothetical protein|nr:hypothetical protein [Lachnospiraceae bacterium]